MQLKKIIEIDPTCIELCHLGDGTGIVKTLETHNAVYHKKCYNKIGLKEYNQLLARVGKKPCNEANSSSSTVIPPKRTKTELGAELCIFCGERDSAENLCAEGEFRSGSSMKNQCVQKLTESWSEMALAIGDLEVHAKLCVGDVGFNSFHMKYFILKITFHNFITDAEDRKLRRMMVQISVKMFYSKHVHGDKF